MMGLLTHFLKVRRLLYKKDVKTLRNSSSIIKMSSFRTITTSAQGLILVQERTLLSLLVEKINFLLPSRSVLKLHRNRTPIKIRGRVYFLNLKAVKELETKDITDQ